MIKGSYDLASYYPLLFSIIISGTDCVKVTS
jgi:hypothetical protein